MITHKEHNKKSGIYSIKNLITGQIYIGSAINLYKRINRHVIDLKENKHTNSKLQNSWNKYKSENFSFEIIELVDKELLLVREQYYLDTILFANKNDNKFKELGFNILKIAGSSIGHKHSDEFRELKRQQSLGNTSGKGTKRSDEQKKIFSEAQLKRYENIPKSRNARQFYEKKSKEELNKIYSESFTEERRKIIVESNKKRVISDETRNKMSAARKGKKFKNEK